VPLFCLAHRNESSPVQFRADSALYRRSLDSRFLRADKCPVGMTKSLGGSRVFVGHVGMTPVHTVWAAIARETEIKKWRREKKLALIEERNPTWEDFGEGVGRGGRDEGDGESRFLTGLGVRNDKE
jgi:hypothetical protein